MNIPWGSPRLFARCFCFIVLVMGSGYAKLNAQQTTLSGRATNESMRPWVTAEIQFTLTSNGNGRGKLTVLPPLYGSGVAQALFRSDTLVITTTDAGGGTILWSGNIRGDSVVGRYVILTKENAGQEGNWAAVRTGGPPLLNSSSQIGAKNAYKTESVQSLMKELRDLRTTPPRREPGAGFVGNPDFAKADQIIKRISRYPHGSDSLTSFLTVEVVAVIASTEPNKSSDIPHGDSGISPNLAEYIAFRICEILIPWGNPPASLKLSLQRMIKDLSAIGAQRESSTFKYGSSVSREVKGVLDRWEWYAKPAPSSSTNTSTCSSTTDTPSTQCLLGWIEGFTRTGGKLWQMCLNHVAGLAAEGYVPNMGGRSDEDDQQLGIRYCIEGSAFVAYARWHQQLRRDAFRTFTRLERAYGIASRARLIVVR